MHLCTCSFARYTPSNVTSLIYTVSMFCDLEEERFKKRYIIKVATIQKQTRSLDATKQTPRLPKSILEMLNKLLSFGS